MARTDTLPHFLTDVADAIREKKGSSDEITASNFDTEIENLPSGGGADLSDYFTSTISIGESNAVSGLQKAIKTIPDNMIISGGFANYLFAGCDNLQTIPLIDTSNCTQAVSMFYNCSNLKSVPLLNFSKVIVMQFIFYGCSSLTSVPQFDTHLVRFFNSIFYGCTNLTTIPILSTAGITNNMENMVYGCPNLTDTSLNNILIMCINATSYTGTKTLYKLGLRSTDYPTSRIEALPNYQNFINAGWSTGY